MRVRVCQATQQFYRLVGELPVVLCLLAWLSTLGLSLVLVYSRSPSLPPGFYVRVLSFQGLRVGDLVVLTPPEAFRPTWPLDQPDALLLKEVAGLAGTHVCWEETRMVVQRPGEERHYLYATPAPTDSRMQGCQVLGAGEMLVVGRHVRSVDSRYLGPVQRGLVRFRAWPLWTQEVL